jgi:hypothetical protein
VGAVGGRVSYRLEATSGKEVTPMEVYHGEETQCDLPLPTVVSLVDWFLVTRAWLLGALLSFDPVVRMDYRQHDANMPRVRLPFTTTQIRSDTALVSGHFALMRDNPVTGAMPDRLAQIDRVAADVEAFRCRVAEDKRALTQYAAALNASPPPLLWWACVAYPPLRHMWTDEEDPL